MRYFPSPGILLIVCVHVCAADLVIEQRIESPKQSGMIRMKVKGNRARIDMPDVTGDVSVFLDQTGKMVTCVHQSKLAITTTLSETEKTAKALIKNSGVEAKTQDPLTPTGQSEKVGDWNCEIWAHYTPTVTQRQWRAKDIPNLPRILEQLKVLGSVPGVGIDQPVNLDSFTVKSERSDAKCTRTTTVVKISEEAVPDADFTLPDGYQDVTVPAK
jgi:hypothetical protein